MSMRLFTLVVSICLAEIYFLTSFAQTESASPPPIEIYGNVPVVKSATLSDSGTKIATLREDERGEYVLVKDYSNAKQSGFKVEGFKPISVDFIADRYVLLRASATESLSHFRGRFEYGFSFLYDVEKDDVYQLLSSERNIVPGSNSGRVVGFLEESGEILMPALTYASSNSALNQSQAGIDDIGKTVFRVKPDTGRTRVFEGDRKGARLSSGGRPKYEHAIDWVISNDGTVVAREDYDPYDNEYRIFTKQDGKWTKIFDNDGVAADYIGDVPYDVVGMTSEEDAILMTGLGADKNNIVLYSLDFAGVISDPILSLEGRDIKRVLSDDNRKVFAVEYSGIDVSYGFLDKALDEKFKALKEKMGDFSIRITDWSAGLNKFLLEISGSGETGSFYLFDVKTGKLSSVEKKYNIPAEWIGATQSIEYKTKDGFTISAVVTWPVGDGEEKLPMIVLPHGGPAAHDSLGFDWMAQYFASRGYFVFQPNFRGSDGFGQTFERAGFGEWGKAMQVDIHDGIRALTSLGWVDRDKICIVGASYGGYAALAGGMTEPDLFKCIAAISPVTDLPDMLSETRREFGERSYEYEYWSNSIGDPRSDSEKLKAVSPARHADVFKVPVLLVHGRDDTVVPVTQSRKMNSALLKAGKKVELVELAGADHWMSTSDARLATLREVAEFVDAQLGSQ